MSNDTIELSHFYQKLSELSRKKLPLDFSHANLENVNLQGYSLRYANFAYANLTYANLTYTDLTGANLTGACLVEANLSHSCLDFAKLQQSNLSSSVLDHASFRQTTLEHSDLQKTKGVRTQFIQANLNNTHFGHSYFSDCSFSRSTLRFADLSGAHWVQCQMISTVLEHVTLLQTFLEKISLTKAIVNECNWKDSVLENVIFPKEKCCEFGKYFAVSITALLLIFGILFCWQIFLYYFPLQLVLSIHQEKLENECLALCIQENQIRSKILQYWQKTGTRLTYQEAQSDATLQVFLIEWKNCILQKEIVEYRYNQISQIKVEWENLKSGNSMDKEESYRKLFEQYEDLRKF